MSEQNDMLRMLYDNEQRLAQTEVKEVPGNIPGFTSFYATGTFVPGYEGSTGAGSYTYSVQAGFYSRIGNRCFFNLSIAAATRPGAPTGNAWIIGLPFTSVATSNSHAAVALDTIDAVTLGGTTIQLTGRIPPSSTRIEFVEVIAAGSALLPATSLTATAFLRVAGHYMVG